MDAPITGLSDGPFRFVQKRDGSLVAFDSTKIFMAILKAGRATDAFTQSEAQQLTEKVLTCLHDLYQHEDHFPKIEEIQDVVQKVLQDIYPATAQAYRVYREERTKKREARINGHVDLIEGYLDRSDWRGKENANQDFALQGLNNMIVSEASSTYWLNKVYSEDIRNGHISGDVHLHDLGLLAPYTYFGQEVITVCYQGKLLMTSFEELYSLVEEEESLYCREHDAWVKYPSDMTILDKTGWTTVARLIRKARIKPMWLVGGNHGRSVIVTEDHPMLVNEQGDEVQAADIVAGMHNVLKLDTKSTLVQHEMFQQCDRVTLMDRHMDFEVTRSLTEPAGYVLGYAVAKGTVIHEERGTLSLPTTDPQVRDCLIHGIRAMAPYPLHPEVLWAEGPYQGIEYVRCSSSFVLDMLAQLGFAKQTTDIRRLPADVLNYGEEFVTGILCGVLDAVGLRTTTDSFILDFQTHRTLMQQVTQLLTLQGIACYDFAEDIFSHSDRAVQLHYLTTVRSRSELELESVRYRQARSHIKYASAELMPQHWAMVSQHRPVQISDPYIYDITTSSHTLCVNGMWNHNCVGWDLRDILLSGFTGVEGAPRSGPAKHLDAALGQIWNFLYTLQGEAAGAQALSSVDTYLAPFIRIDKLTFREVKQKMQSFMFNMNTKTRVGFQCVPDSYTCMTPTGWRRHDELRIGDEIYVCDTNTGEIRIDRLTHLTVFHYEGDMIRFSGRKIDFMVTPNHRVVRKVNNLPKLVIEEAQIVEQYRTPTTIPLAGVVQRQGLDWSNELIELLGWALTDCHMDVKASRLRIYQSPKKHAKMIELLLCKLNANYTARVTGGDGFGDPVICFDVKGELAKFIIGYTGGVRDAIPRHFLNNANRAQLMTLLGTVVLADGTMEESGRIRIGKKSDYMAMCLQELCALVGLATRRGHRTTSTDVISIHKNNLATTTTSRVAYSGTVWCPTTNTGTFICRGDDGVPFITGNCPFTNLSMDLTIPKDLGNEPVIIGGRYHEEWKYGDFQAEVDLFNRAFAEVMLEGDADGRLFSFPIPTYNIDKGFDFENPENDGIWKMTAKYGTPYFTNYLSSGLDAGAFRAMCPLHPTEKVELMASSVKMTLAIGDAYKSLKNPQRVKGVFVRLMDKWVPIVGMTEVDAQGYVVVSTMCKESTTFELRHEQPIRRSETDPVELIQAQDIEVGMWLPYGTKIGRAKTFQCDQGFFWYQVLDVQQFLDPEYPKAYCFLVDTPEHLFQLESGLVTHNCRLMLDVRELQELEKRGGGLFGSAPLTGSVGVVTVNMPRIGYQARYSPDHKEFFAFLDARMDLAKKSLLIKRDWLEKATELGLYPFSRYYLRNIKARYDKYWTNHFCTIGLNGMNEACLNYLGAEYNIGTKEGREFALLVLDHMRERIHQYQQETGVRFNLEASPAEGVGYRFALLDRKRYPGIIAATSHIPGAEPHYTNSTQLPVDYTPDLFEALDLQDELQCKYTGGTILHGYIGEEIKDFRVVRDLVKRVFTKYKLPYFSITPTFSICRNHGYLTGEQPQCKTCGAETEVYTRVVGYYRPISAWNKGKQAEAMLRLSFDNPPELLN